jgi:zinc protease
LHTDEYGLDKHDTLNYLKNSLNMSMEDIKENIDNLDADDLQNVAEWVAHGCLSMDQMLSDVAYEKMDEFSRVIAKKITNEDVKAFYKKHIVPSKAQIVIVGQVEQAEILGKLGFLKTWTGTAPENAVLPAFPAIDKTKIYFVNKDKAPQSEIRIGYMSLPYDADGEYYRAGIMNYQLGGNFNSRINLTLREKKGYTYGARSGFNGTKFPGPYTASAGVKAEKTDSSLMDFFSEMATYRAAGITPEELSFTKSSLGQRDALKYETPFQKASFLSRILTYNLDKDFISRQSSILQGISKNDIDGLAKRYLPLEKMIVVVVGDKNQNLEPVKKLGYEVVELDIDGNPLK